MAAVQTEEQVVQLDTDARRAVFALVAQSEENIQLTAVPATRAQQRAVTLCTWFTFTVSPLAVLHNTH